MGEGFKLLTMSQMPRSAPKRVGVCCGRHGGCSASRLEEQRWYGSDEGDDEPPPRDARGPSLLLSPVRAEREHGARLARVSVGAAVAVGAVLGLLLGIVVSVASDLPFAPEGGLVLGALLGWLWRRKGST
jgi:hypothetical protein